MSMRFNCGRPCRQPHSCGFPEGLLDQPFDGWVGRRNRIFQPVSTGFHDEALAVPTNAKAEEKHAEARWR